MTRGRILGFTLRGEWYLLKVHIWGDSGNDRLLTLVSSSLFIDTAKIFFFTPRVKWLYETNTSLRPRLATPGAIRKN